LGLKTENDKDGENLKIRKTLVFTLSEIPLRPDEHDAEHTW
jgi:hypothetical protein